MVVIKLASWLLFAWFAWAVLYQLVFAVAGHFFKKEKGQHDGKTRRFAVLIPAYREDGVILDTARAALRMDYPAGKFEVVVIADQLQEATLDKLRQMNLRLLEISLPKSTKSRAINAALEQLPSDFDAVAVLDADNHAASDFLLKMNATLARGHGAVQGRRAAKNADTALAMLDGAAEAANTHILCSGHRALGLSARLAGSGMAFEYKIFRWAMVGVDALGGFDKELELKLTQRGVQIAYAPDAVVFDEKVRHASTFARQRGRWLAAQYRYGARFALPALRALWHEGRLDFFNKTVQMALPPRLILPGVVAVGAAVSFAVEPSNAPAWLAVLAGIGLTYSLAVPRVLWSGGLVRALVHLPATFAAAVHALALMPRAGREFLHTPHAPAVGAVRVQAA